MKNMTQVSLSKTINLALPTLNKKLTNKVSFKQIEIINICNALNIPDKDIPLYFFSR